MALILRHADGPAHWHDHFINAGLMSEQIESPELAVSPIEVEHGFDRLTEHCEPRFELTALVPDAMDETARARRALRGLITLRLGEGEEHRVAGRIADAIRSFESVLVFDRKNELACARLAQLRPNISPTSRLDWLGRCFCMKRAARCRGDRGGRATAERRAAWADTRRREGAAPKFRGRRAEEV
jgi:hypothetical protein